jgi:hypothetical protein
MIKGAGFVVIIILLVIASLIGITLVATNDKLKSENEALSKDKILTNQKLIVEKKRSGQLSAKNVALNINLAGTKALLEAKDDYLLRLVNDYDIKPKNLRTAVNVKSKLEAEITAKLDDSVINKLDPLGLPIDTVKVKIFHYKDDWLTARGIIRGDSIMIQPTFKNDQDIITHMERKEKRAWWDLLPGKQLMVEVVNRNPYSSVTSLKAIVSTPRKKILGIF